MPTLSSLELRTVMCQDDDVQSEEGILKPHLEKQVLLLFKKFF